MTFWLVTVGEPLPTDAGGSERLLRTGLLAEKLNSRGHHVVWWTSTFDHKNKRQRFDCTTQVFPRPNYEIHLIRGIGYRKNVSVTRLADHWIMASRFSRYARTRERPDVIVASLPTIELALAASEYAAVREVPMVIDVRDLWPDIFVELFPKSLRRFGGLLLTPMNSQVRRALRLSTSIIANSEPFLRWGLSLAGRPRGERDGVFPFGYVESIPTETEREVAIRYWRGVGISNSSQSLTACFFGTLGRQFNIDVVIAAAKRLASSGRKVRLVLCGDGERSSYYRSMARGLDNVVFPGWVGKAEIWTLMRISHMGLAPYVESDAFSGNVPNKPIEYLSGGLPVIISGATHLGALLEAQGCGIRYRSSDPEALFRAIALLHDDPELRARMSGRAHDLYRREFVAENVYGRLVQHLEHLSAHGFKSA